MKIEKFNSDEAIIIETITGKYTIIDENGRLLIISDHSNIILEPISPTQIIIG